MPGRLKVRILSARDLPVMDRASELTDAFVEIRFGNENFKTDVCKKSLHPQWNSEWFKFEVDDEVLQDEPLDLRVLDYDTYSAHDAIGKVYIDLNPLLNREITNTISGWFPIYDTMHGIRGELNVQVRVELFTDFNKFRQSSCGIQLFCTSEVPSGWRIQSMLGFIEELVVNDDPEYQWIEKIRTPRASNEARQKLFSKLSGELQRKLGVKVHELGGNAVLGYHQNFDLEGESGIIVRGIGTAVALSKCQLGQPSPIPNFVSPGRDLRRHSVSIHQRSNSTSHHHSHNENQPLRRNRRQSESQPKRTSLSQSPSAIVETNQNMTLSNAPLTSPKSTSPNPKSPSVKHPPPLSVKHPPPLSVKLPPPSAPAIVMGEKTKSVFTFPSSSSEDTVTNTSTPLQTNTSTNTSTITPSSNNKPVDKTSAASNHPIPSAAISQRHSTSPMRETHVDSSRRLSDSDLNTPSKGGSLHSSGNNSNVAVNMAVAVARMSFSTKTAVLPQGIDLLEYPFFTMKSYPTGFIHCLGGVVSARSVKLLDKIHNPEEPETRDAWWSELRTEVKAHAAKLGCHAVLGYQEQTSICDEVIILSAMGTAANLNMNFDQGRGSVISPAAHVQSSGPSGPSAIEKSAASEANNGETREKHLFVDISLANQNQLKHFNSIESADDQRCCSICHIPYNPSNLPFPIHLSKCAICRRRKVPEVLFTTLDPPVEMAIWSKGCLVQARICRSKSKTKSSEHAAREVSDSLPFVEYELHSQLINKLKIRGLNGLFGLTIQISLGENMLVAIATATGAYIGALPIPPQPKVSSVVATDEETYIMLALQKKIDGIVQMHRDRLTSEIVDSQNSPHSGNYTDEDSDIDMDEGGFNLERTTDKSTFVLMIDDLKDESVSMIIDDFVPPEGFDMCNTQRPPGLTSDRLTGNLQMFTQMVQIRYHPSHNSGLEFSSVFNVLLRRICFKMRHLKPCYLTDISFTVDMPDEDEVNLAITGCCLGIQEINNQSNLTTKHVTRPNDSLKAASLALQNQTDDMIFPLEGVADSTCTNVVGKSTKMNKDVTKSVIAQPPLGIELTPLNIVYNGRIEKYLGYYNFFFIRESTSVRECGGVGGFMQSFILEVMAIVRAHVAAIGGNALTAYHMSQCVLDNNPHKNQGQCLINVSGDIVVVSHDLDGDVVFETPFIKPTSVP